jgi:hypothetical protein
MKTLFVQLKAKIEKERSENKGPYTALYPLTPILTVATWSEFSLPSSI